MRGLSVDGRPLYPGLLLFKMLLLQTWYCLSDPGIEDMVKERAALVDASITNTPRRPKGKTKYEIAEDRKEDLQSEKSKQEEGKKIKLVKQKQPGVDEQGRWLKKGGKLHYGLKKHIATDQEGLVTSVHSTTANEHDRKGLKPLLKKTPRSKVKKGTYADKGYKVPDNDKLLEELNIKNRLQHKAYRNRPLTKWKIRFNKLISKDRYIVECSFGGMKRWFRTGVAKYVGLDKPHTQHVLEAIAYNLYRFPRNVMFNVLR
jgi:IS5 family transposase